MEKSIYLGEAVESRAFRDSPMLTESYNINRDEASRIEVVQRRNGVVSLTLTSDIGSIIDDTLIY